MVEEILSFVFSIGPYIAIGILILIAIWLLGIRFIPNNQVGIVEKCISRKKAITNSIIALNGEAGFQAEVLRGGIHILPRIFNKLHKANLITISQGEIGYVFARDGLALKTSQTLGCCVDCKNFENVREFLANGGQKGPQRSILREGTYAINLAQFIVLTADKEYYMPLGLPGEAEAITSMKQTITNRNGFKALIVSEKNDQIGIVTVHDGPSLPAGELIADSTEGHDQFQDPQAFIDNNGYRGRQKDVLTDGTYFINALFASVETQPKTEISIGNVGVVNYFTGPDGEDISGEGYEYGTLVKKWEKGVWAEVLQPGKYPWNPYAGEVRIVPTTNVVLNWSTSEKGDYDSKLAEITLITEDAFKPSLPISAVISINGKDAAKVVQRFGDIQSLVEETLDPFVGSYFKNIAQKKTLKQLIQERSEIQESASKDMRIKFKEYNLNLVEVLIGTPQNSVEDSRIEELYTLLQNRQLAEEEIATYAAQAASESENQKFQKAKQAAAMQDELTKSEMEIAISENRGAAEVKAAEQAAKVTETNAKAASTKMEIDAEAAAKKMEIDAKANATRITVEAEAKAKQVKVAAEARAFETQSVKEAEAKGISAIGSAEANAIGKKGLAEAVAYQEKVNAFGQSNFTQIELIAAISEAIQNYSGNLVPSTLINMGEGSEKSGSNNLLETLILKSIVEKEFGSGESAATPQSEVAQEYSKHLKEQLLNITEDVSEVEISEDKDDSFDESTQESSSQNGLSQYNQNVKRRKIPGRI